MRRVGASAARAEPVDGHRDRLREVACVAGAAALGRDQRPPEALSGGLQQATERLGRPLVAAERGGASDASHLAQAVPVTVDGLGPRGGGAHAPHEWVSARSLRTRAEVALALAAAILGGR